MTSLGEAYDRNQFEGRDPRRVLGGSALLIAGGFALVASILLIGTAGSDALTAKKHAGTLAGLGVPTLLLGVVVVLPASRRQRAGVVLGAAITVAAVAFFWHIYPQRWDGAADPLMFETTMTYFVGGAIACWHLFSPLATFRRRNTPHGTVTMEVVRQGTTQTVEMSQDRYQHMVSDGGDASQLIRELDAED